jgi:hypothetical protein
MLSERKKDISMENKQPKHPPLNSSLLALIAVSVGVIGGFGAVAFRALIALFHNLLFLGKFSLVYEANIHTPLGAICNSCACSWRGRGFISGYPFRTRSEGACHSRGCGLQQGHD